MIRFDRVALGWLTFVTVGALSLLWTIGLDGLVNHGDTGFPLDAVQRFVDGIWAWNSRLNFGVPQYLAHSTLPFDAVRSIPALLGFSVQVQSQLFFVGSIVLLGLAAERFATVGLLLKRPLSRLVVATVLVVNPFNVNQLLGGQGLQLCQVAALVAALTAFLTYTRTRRLGALGWFAVWSLFVGMVFFPFLAVGGLIITCATTPRRDWLSLVSAWSVTLAINAFWIVPFVARSLAAPVIGEIFQADSALRVLDATRAFTGLEWVGRLAYGHYPTITPYVAFLQRPLSVAIGLTPALVALWLVVRSRSNPTVRAFSLIWFGSLVLSTGLHYRLFAGSYAWLFHHVALFQAYRVPTKFLVLEMIGLAAVLGVGFEAAQTTGKVRARRGWAWLAAGIIVISGATGGLFHSRSIGRQIALAHYPSNYFDRTERAGRWLELLPAAARGGYVPTQDLPIKLARVYSPAGSAFDQATSQAVAIGTEADFLSARGLDGWLIHGDIPTMGPLATALAASTEILEFRPVAAEPASLVSVFAQPVVTNKNLPDNSILASQPGIPYLVSTDVGRNQPGDQEPIQELIHDEQVIASPFTLPAPALTGRFRLVTSFLSAVTAVTLTVGESHVPVVANEHGVGVSDPISLDGQSPLVLTVPSVTSNRALLAGPIEFDELSFENQGPRAVARGTTNEIKLSCDTESRAGRITIRGIDPDAIYRLTFQAISDTLKPHAAFEWLDTADQPMAMAPTFDEQTFVRPRSRAANLYLYCEPSGSPGTISYRSIELTETAGFALSQTYLVPERYPTFSGVDRSIDFTRSSSVSFRTTGLPPTGVLVLRQSDDRWWVATDGTGRRLQKVGRAYGLFPAWELNGASSVTIQFVGQRYFSWGIVITTLAWVGFGAFVLQARRGHAPTN